MAIFLYNVALSESVAPIAASQIHVKVDWSSLHFSQKFNLRSKHRLHTLTMLTFARSLGRWRCLKPRTTDLVVIERHLISQVYMDEVLRSVVLLFVRKPVTVPDLG